MSVLKLPPQWPMRRPILRPVFGGGRVEKIRVFLPPVDRVGVLLVGPAQCPLRGRPIVRNSRPALPMLSVTPNSRQIKAWISAGLSQIHPCWRLRAVTSAADFGEQCWRADVSVVAGQYGAAHDFADVAAAGVVR